MKTAFLTALILAFQIPTSFAGAGSSGGGFAVVCRDLSSNIVSAELLDLYEARNRYGLKLLESTGSLEGDYVLAVQNTYHIQGYDTVLIEPEVRKSLSRFFEIVEFRRSPSRIPSINDIGSTVLLPNNCRAEQVALFVDSADRVLINEELWDKLTPQGQAALVTHELMYHQERKYFEKTSEASRSIVAHIYSENAVPVINDRITRLSFGSTAPRLIAGGEQVMSTFYSARVENRLTIYLTNIFGRPLVTESKASFDVNDIQFRNGLSLDGNKMQATSNVTKLTKIKSVIISNQSKNWQLELTLIPNGPIKMGLYQDGILLEEGIVTNI